MTMQCYDLKGKTAIITGATKGIGKEIAIKLSNYGANITLVARNKKDLMKIKKIIDSSGNKSIAISADVSNLNSFNDIISQTIDKWDKIDILINNAGITKDNIIMRMKEEEWEDVVNVNLKGCFNGIKAVSREMMKNKYGKIINITSIVGHTGNLGQSNYAASKAGIIGMSKSLAIEYAKKNITINCVSPGFIQSKMTDNIVESIKSILTSKIPMSKLGTGEDVANTVAFLASDSANYITGETIHVNGGMYMA